MKASLERPASIVATVYWRTFVASLLRITLGLVATVRPRLAALPG
jgi:hypothetical protein